MKRLLAVVLVSLLVTAVPTGSATADHIVHASGLHAATVRLESLPIGDDAQGVANISAERLQASYHGTPLSNGLQLTPAGYTHARIQLGFHYSQLSGTVYGDDKNTNTGVYFDIYDTSYTVDTSRAKLLYRYAFNVTDGRGEFRLNVRDVSYITIAMDNAGVLDVVATVSNGQIPPPKKATQVIPRYPTGNAGVPAESKVLFAWNAFPHATNYAFHIWLVGLSGSAPLTPATPFSFSASVYHKTTYTWDDHGFLPGTYQYSLLPLDDNGHNLAGWSTPTQITIASS